MIYHMNYYWRQDKKQSYGNAFNNASADIKLSKVQINKIIQSGGYLRSLLSKSVGPLMKVAVPPLGITTAASAIDAGIQKTNKNTWIWDNNFNNSNAEMNDIIKIVQAL